MSEWDASHFESKDNLLQTVRNEAEGLFALAEAPNAWEAPTACSEWQVRDVIGHIVETTEGYAVAFDAARGAGTPWEALGLEVMKHRANQGARAFRSLSQDEMMRRVRRDFAMMMQTFEALEPEEWAGLTVAHRYMGPLPAFFYPVFQLMDYGVHSWDVREGAGQSHALAGDTADLLAPFMFILWQATLGKPPRDPLTVGVRVTSGHNAGDFRVDVDEKGFTFDPGPVDDLPAVLEFDPASLVLTTFGRSNSGTVRGEAATANRFLNLFFRI